MPRGKPRSQRDVAKRPTKRQSQAPKTIQGRLAQLKTKLKDAPTIADAMNTRPRSETSASTHALDELLRQDTITRRGHSPLHIPNGPIVPIPFTNLGRWVVHTIHSVFGDQRATVRQLAAGLRNHVTDHRRLYNEHQKYLSVSANLKTMLPPLLFKLVGRMAQLFDFRERIYTQGARQISEYLRMMIGRAEKVFHDLTAQESNVDRILKEWTQVLEHDRDVLAGHVRQSADCADPASRTTFHTESDTTHRQLAHLLQQGKDLFDKIEELRKYRSEAIVAGNRSLTREIENHLRDALSRAHAIAGARQYFYTAQSSPNVLQFTAGAERLKSDMVKLLTLPKLYYNDYELAAKQLQSTIDEHIGGMRLFATLKLQQEFSRVAGELEEELCLKIDGLFQKTQSELKLLNEELMILNTEFLAEFARAGVNEDLRELTARYIKALYVSSSCKMARVDEPFAALVRTYVTKASMEPVFTGIAPLVGHPEETVEQLTDSGQDSDSDSDSSQTASSTPLDPEYDAESETSSKSGESQ